MTYSTPRIIPYLLRWYFAEAISRTTSTEYSRASRLPAALQYW